MEWDEEICDSITIKIGDMCDSGYKNIKFYKMIGDKEKHILTYDLIVIKGLNIQIDTQNGKEFFIHSRDGKNLILNAIGRISTQ